MRRRRDILKTIQKFTCPYCEAVVGCDELGRPGMYSLKMYNRHVQKCQEVLEAMRSGSAKQAQQAKEDL